ncbi:hypothetical protein CY34DRAFT_811507 [Suillus luteus UH-Slu-Lm8-n1]|uniref:Uncharacterized protein n=1 Tax=Suillus luteus UH-Slu-Lm8-n1 TaxID=930992 RepID=A0A0C9ZFC7_9AGAM|nr:hypothetical protein CY34DRAFT_811507 [Suillus luteus UH-Slu-Lm8-n1]
MGIHEHNIAVSQRIDYIIDTAKSTSARLGFKYDFLTSLKLDPTLFLFSRISTTPPASLLQTVQRSS